MDARSLRKNRLCQLVDLVRDYRGVSRRELGRLLGRSPERLIPESGIPKLDLVVKIANLLDWPVNMLVSFAMAEGNGKSPAAEELDYEELQTASRAAWLEGQYIEAVTLAQRAYAVAATPDQRALACNREVAGWNGVGHHTKALRALRKGLAESAASLELRLLLQSNMANAYYTGWELVQARSIASDLIEWYRNSPPQDHRNQSSHAFAYYVRGNTLRRLIDTEPVRSREHAECARKDLRRAIEYHLQLAERYKEDSYSGVANTCRGGLVEVEVVLGLRDPGEAVQHILDGLDPVVDPAAIPAGDWLESYGWWCIFGCNIALRHLTDERQLQHCMAVFTDKADVIASRLDNWAIRERVFTMEYTRNQRIVHLTGRKVPVMLDEDDLHALIGTMGRFPMFFDTGLRLLESATVVRG
jgi:tetratricopeptide (TPR) repeat protein